MADGSSPKPIESQTYIISTRGSILVDGGYSDDQIIMIGNIGSNVIVRSGSGRDTLEVRPTGNTNSVYVFSDMMKVNGAQIRYSEIEELKVKGNSKTVLNIEPPTQPAARKSTSTQIGCRVSFRFPSAIAACHRSLS